MHFEQVSLLICPISSSDRAEKLLKFLEHHFNEVFEEEQRIRRNPKFEEHRVHVLLYFLEPTNVGLKEFDASFMKCIAPRVNVIPVIAQADGLTELERDACKKLVLTSRLVF